jgi:hypothetical protein
MKILIITDATSPDRRDFAQAAMLARATSGSVEVYVCDADARVPEDLRRFMREEDFGELRRESVLEVLEEFAAPLRHAGVPVAICYEPKLACTDAILKYIGRSRPDWLARRGALLPLKSQRQAATPVRDVRSWVRP